MARHFSRDDMGSPGHLCPHAKLRLEQSYLHQTLPFFHIEALSATTYQHQEHIFLISPTMDKKPGNASVTPTNGSTQTMNMISAHVQMACGSARFYVRDSPSTSNTPYIPRRKVCHCGTSARLQSIIPVTAATLCTHSLRPRHH